MLTKLDRLSTPDAVASLIEVDAFSNSVVISALTGDGVESLLARVESVLEDQMVALDVLVPFESGELVNLFHQRGLVEKETFLATGVHLVGRIPGVLLGRFHGLEMATEE